MKKKFSLLIFCFVLTFVVSPVIAEENYLIFLKSHDESVNRVSLNRDFSNRGEIISEMQKEWKNILKDFTLRNGEFKVLDSYWSCHAILVNKKIADKIRTSREIHKIVPDTLVYPEKAVKTEDVEADGTDVYTYGLKNMRVPEVWEKFGTRGRGVLVGIIDSGVDGKHLEFQDRSRFYKYNDFVGITNMSDMSDDLGHGSHVAGTIGGSNLSGKFIGVAPDCSLIIAKAIGRGGTRVSKLLDAMEWMIDPDGKPETNDQPRVVNCSWHSGYGDQTPYYAMLKTWLKTGIIPCFSAGNSGPSASTITKPKEFPGSFCTAAVDKNLNIANFSSRGPANYNGTDVDKPDWANPGVDVFSVRAGGKYTKKSGTSMASPHTAGLIALMLSVRPELTVEDVREILKNSSVDSGSPGYDHTFGHGYLDAVRAVSLARSSSNIIGKVKYNGNGIKSIVTVKELGMEFATDSEGNFRIMVTPGLYTLTASKYGYTSSSVSVKVESLVDSHAAFELKDGNRINISGKITVKEEKTGIPAEISLVNHEEFKTIADNEGRYSLEVQSGNLQFAVKAKKYESVLTEKKIYEKDTVLNIEMESLPPVLVVVSDKGKGIHKFYTEALDELKIRYNTHIVKKDGIISEKDLLPYHVVIWITGELSSGCIKASDKNILRNYLDLNGNLFLSGQEIGYALKSDKDFLNNVLKIKYIKDKALTREIKNKEFGTMKIEGGDGANNQRYPDVISPVNGSETYLTYGDKNEIAAVKYSGGAHIIAAGFGFEAISTESNRMRVMKDIAVFLMPQLKNKVSRIKGILSSDISDNLKTEIVDMLAPALADEIVNSSDEEFSSIKDMNLDNEILEEAVKTRLK